MVSSSSLVMIIIFPINEVEGSTRKKLNTNHPAIGFVETAGYRDFAYIVWEEGSGLADEGLGEDASIVVGILFPDGRVIGLGK